MAANFKDEDFDVVSITRRRYDQQNKVDKISQTNSQTWQCTATQTDQKSAAVQTDTVVTIVGDKVELTAEKESEVKSFLKKAVPLLINEIEQKRVIDDWMTAIESVWSGTGCNYSLKCSLKPAEENLNHISAIVWNSSGSILAVSYGYKNHEDWPELGGSLFNNIKRLLPKALILITDFSMLRCFHQSAIAAWNKSSLHLKNNKPDWYFPAVECYSDIKFHPTFNKLLAAGMTNGVIQLYDFSTSGNHLVESTREDKAQPQLNSLHWLCVEKKRTYLASCSASGIIQLYLFGSDRKLKLHRCFVITQEHLPRVLRGSVHSNWPVGMVDLAILAGDSGDFVAAGETGALFLCNVKSKEPSKSILTSEISMPQYNPVILQFDPHWGALYCLASNPVLDGLFCSSGMERKIKLFLSPSNVPIREYSIDQPAGCLFWSTNCPTVFGCSMAGGRIAFYDILKSGDSPCFTLNASNDWTEAPLVSWNPETSLLLACSDKAAVVNVWQLTDDLTDNTGNLRKAFRRMYVEQSK
ncbi:hypothetical protein TTRE_0000722201 [Trichuris trichiura]|uniref:WD40 domain containing protein n=1 Tax=Trichuris trichiura TaxID=36087 RepID=A0A077ZEV7_TRITR|nr:hypothetical protein TTRE_0000722201 [Trichuris trichiura]